MMMSLPVNKVGTKRKLKGFIKIINLNKKLLWIF